MITRRLNYNDFDKIEQLIKLRWNHIQKRRDSEYGDFLLDRIKKYLDLSIDIENKKDVGGLCQALGSFDDNNNLIAFCTQKFWSKLPFYYMGNMVTKPGLSNLYNVGLMGLGKTWDYAVKFAEDRNYFKWYWVVEVRGWNKREEEWYKNSSSFKRYHVFIDSMYNKDEKGKFSYQNTMLGEHGAYSTVAIKYAVLKPKYLHNLFKKRGYLRDEFNPIQYKQDDIVEDNIKIKFKKEDSLIFKEILDYNQVRNITKDELNMLVDKDYYKQNFPDISKGEYKHFGAYDKDKLVGTSSMIKYFDTESNKIKIYHLWSWTHPNYRRRQIWLKLMKYKVDYMNKNNWCLNNNTNFVTTSFEDERYANIGWTFSRDISKIYNNKHVSKRVWRILWKDMKKRFNIL